MEQNEIISYKVSNTEYGTQKIFSKSRPESLMAQPHIFKKISPTPQSSRHYHSSVREKACGKYLLVLPVLLINLSNFSGMQTSS